MTGRVQPAWVAQYHAAFEEGTPDLAHDVPHAEIDEACEAWDTIDLEAVNDGTDDVLVLIMSRYHNPATTRRYAVAYIDPHTHCWCAYRIKGAT